MKKLITGSIDESIFLRLKEKGYNTNQMIVQGTALLLKKLETEQYLSELQIKVNDEKYKLEQIVKKQEQLDHSDENSERSSKPIDVFGLKSKFRSSNNPIKSEKMETISPTSTQDNYKARFKQIWSGKVWMGYASIGLGYECTITFDEYDEMLGLARHFSKEIATLLHDESIRYYDGSFVGLKITTISRIDEMLGVNSFNTHTLTV